MARTTWNKVTQSAPPHGIRREQSVVPNNAHRLDNGSMASEGPSPPPPHPETRVIVMGPEGGGPIESSVLEQLGGSVIMVHGTWMLATAVSSGLRKKSPRWNDVVKGFLVKSILPRIRRSVVRRSVPPSPPRPCGRYDMNRAIEPCATRNVSSGVYGEQTISQKAAMGGRVGGGNGSEWE